MARVMVIVRSIVLAGVLPLVILSAGSQALAEESTAYDPLFSMDAYAQARAGVDSRPWSDPLEFMQGTDNAYVTRGDLAIRLADLLGLENSTACYFSDLRGPEDCFAAVGALYEAGLLAGETSSYFFPEHLATRQEAAAWIVGALESKLGQEIDSLVPIRFSYYESADRWLGAFRDRGLVSGALARRVANAYRLSIVEPSEDGYLYPSFAVSVTDLQGMLDRAFASTVQTKTSYPTAVGSSVSYPELKVKSEGSLVWELEYRLAALKYRPGLIDGVFDVRTRDAVYAFQKVEGLEEDGIVGASFWEKLAVAETPRPAKEEAGDRVEVDLGRQVLFMIRDNQVTKIVHVSSGKSKTQTLWGEFTIDKKVPRWLHDSYNTTMYYSSFFSVEFRLAFHGYSEVPTWPASHGCVRTPIWMAKELYEEMPLGTHVYIYL